MITSAYKRLVRRLTRSAFAETERMVGAVQGRLETIDGRLDAINGHLYSAVNAVWRGTLAEGGAVTADGHPAPLMTEKYRGELAFWVRFVNHPELYPEYKGGYEGLFGRGHRDRVLQLGAFLGLEGEAATDDWCARQSAIEFGPGPFPMLAAARWRSAVAVDPLADGYVAEGLLPSNGLIDGVVYLSSAGESVPLTAGRADLVVIENCLDHVSDPMGVLGEIVRLLRPGGYVWLLVDLMEFTDSMHPHAFSEERLRDHLRAARLEIVREEVRTDRHSHPEAHGEFRALLKKPAALSR